MKSNTPVVIICLTVVALFFTRKSFAQKDTIQTIFSSKKKQEASVRFFFEPEAKLFFQSSDFKEPLALTIGSKTALIVNKSMIIGIGGYGKVTPSTYYNEYRYTDKLTGEEVVVPSQKMV